MLKCHNKLFLFDVSKRQFSEFFEGFGFGAVSYKTFDIIQSVNSLHARIRFFFSVLIQYIYFAARSEVHFSHFFAGIS